MEHAIVDVFALRVRLAAPMLHLLYALLATARSSLKSQRELELENLALRQQLAILKRTTTRPKLTHAERAFWVALSRLWTGWQHALILVKPETVIGWHRKGLRLYWTRKSRNRTGRRAHDPRKSESIDQGKVIAFPMVGGLHHRYNRVAA